MAQDLPLDIPELQNRFHHYLSKLLLSFLPPDSASYEQILAESLVVPSHQELLIRFLGTAEQTVLYFDVTRSELKVGVEWRSPTQESLAFFSILKCKEAALDATKPLSNQLQVISFVGDMKEEQELQESKASAYLQNIHMITKHIFAPIARSVRQSSQVEVNIAHQISDAASDEEEFSTLLNKRIRELDSALDQYQRGSSIPSVTLPIPPPLVEASKLVTADALRALLDRYNASQVDSLFSNIQLTNIMGDTEERKEEFANEVNKTAKLWPNEIIKQSRLTESPFAGSVEKEINFWKDLDRKLNETREQLDSAPILLTKLVLKRTNRVSEQLIHDAEVALDRALGIVGYSLAFMRDFPLEELHSINALNNAMVRCVANCLSHFSKLRHSKYDFTRAIRLLEVVGTAILNKIVLILDEKKILTCTLEELLSLKSQWDEVLFTWQQNLLSQRQTLKDVARRRGEKFLNLKFDFEALQARLTAVVDFRQHHERMLTILGNVLAGSDSDFISELTEGYHLFVKTNSNIFDLTTAGATAWATGMQLYERRMEKVEEKITRVLEERLSAAKSADEMFRTFSLFNPLFFRPAIRTAVNSFRATLMKSVREDVKRLQDKFKHRYDESQERIAADLRDIPPLSGRIVWARQIEHQLSMLIKRIQDVLGVGWEDHIEGKQLKEVCDELRSFLDTNQILEEWINAQMKADSNKYSKVKDFLLLVEPDPRTSLKALRVNFDERQIVVYKEVKYLEWLLPNMEVAFKSIPSTIKSRSLEAYNRYPVALALESALTTYRNANNKINTNNILLLAHHVQAVRDLIREAVGGSKSRKWLKWDSPDLQDWVSQLLNKIYNLQDRVDELNEKLKFVDKCMDDLKVCDYDKTEFENVLRAIQGVVDELPMKGLSNIPSWVTALDKRIEEVLMIRLIHGIKGWLASFSTNCQLDQDDGLLTDALNRTLQSEGNPLTGEEAKEVADDGNRLESAHRPVLNPTVHEIAVSNQVIFIQPSLEVASKYWINEYHKFLSSICTLPRIVPMRMQVFADSAATAANDYSSILKNLDGRTLSDAYVAIQSKVAQARQYTSEWLQYQALWDAPITTVFEKLGRDLRTWQQFLEDVKLARAAVDTSMEEKAFGPIIVNHKPAQNKINLKYDTWQRESQTKFCSLVTSVVKSVNTDMVTLKSRLESITFEGSTKEAISGVHIIMQAKEAVREFGERIQEMKAAEKLLQSQRFHFPAEWIPVSNAVSSFADLNEILDRRTATMNAQLPVLQMKIKEEDIQVQARTEKFLESWNVQKPIEGMIAPVQAIESLSLFAGQLSKLLEDANRLRAAKESLQMDYIMDDQLNFVESEITDLRSAWMTVAPVHDRLQILAGNLLLETNPAQLRKQLEELVADVKQFPIKYRSYAAVETIQDRLQKYLAFQPVVRELSTDALKDRHWKVILDRVGLKVNFKLLTLGILWDSTAMTHRKFIAEVLSSAQGELALEQFLRDLRDHWLSRELAVATRDTAKIIAGWDNLFSTLEDNLNSIAALKQSPYFRNVPEIQEDAANWENRLTHLRAIFELWIEVQRKWLYLRGIFKNGDIKAQLPAQFSKFKSIDNEYSSLMKRVSTKPIALEVLQLDNLPRQLEREDATMLIIQKALGEYLERQRQIFPRFYFVNNDDLVEIIGNSNEPNKIIVHLSKMFAAVAGLRTNLGTEEDVGKVLATAMLSREGEVVKLKSAIDLGIGVKEWLGSLHSQMGLTLSTLIDQALQSLNKCDDNLLQWIGNYPSQVCIIAIQILWTRSCEEALSANRPLEELEKVGLSMNRRLEALSTAVLRNLEAETRQKTEQILTEMVHQREVLRSLLNKGAVDAKDFSWLYHLRFYWNPQEENLLSKMMIRMSNASFHYGFEYLGIGERLVQTPLTDRCYLTLTQALHFRMGGNPFGPAGTGKTESVKMLGSQLGRFVLVFNCDSSFDYAAMGRIFSGLCQVGAWGCFDEFNRLEERILSAVSQQILTIQRGLLNNMTQIDLLGQPCKLSKDVGIFVTLNPGYVGRSNLPDNLKQLFRAVAMSAPDRKLIAQVMLFSQGIVTADDLAGKITLLFILCEEQLSVQSHYDFGLRALKSVLVGAGELKRKALATSADVKEEEKQDLETLEKDVLLKSTCDSVMPKLIAEDIPVFIALLMAVFPGSTLPAVRDDVLMEAIRTVAEEDKLELGHEWVEKIVQLKQIQDIRHGIMLMGPAGSGKSSAYRTLLKALAKMDGVKGDAYVIDPKAISKNKLFGTLDPITLEWTDGIFTKILRKLTDPSSVRGVRRSWIIFDGDVDPEWAENLNSVLDDNKVLTLPSGDRLKIPANVRIVLEVDNLKHTTLATVSRCGMVWFADNTITMEMAFQNVLQTLKSMEMRSQDDTLFTGELLRTQIETRDKFVEALAPHFLNAPSLVEFCLQYTMRETHVMEATISRLLETLLAMLQRGVALCFEYNEQNVDLPMSTMHLESFAIRWLIFSLLWSVGSSLSTEKRSELAQLINDHCTVPIPTGVSSFLELQPNLQDGEWQEWSVLVPRMEIATHEVSSSDVVIRTVDTVRHVEVIRAWLSSRRPLILCGPPGSGKTMTLTSVLESMPDCIFAPLSFSSGTGPEIILKTFAQYCEVIDSPDGLTLQPNRQSYRDSQWLVIFCDEINLPAQDVYGTQRVIMFLRQLVEQRGYWNADCKWIHLRRIQFVGACNPPTDAGRVELSRRFLRHAPVLYVDYPAEASLKQIYRCFNQALLRIHPGLKGYVDPLNDAMVDFYLQNKAKFTADLAPQYIYSPRELSRWVRALYEAIENVEALTAEELVRVWAHEALRLFQDRLIFDDDRRWCNDLLDTVAAKHFPGVDIHEALKRPILFNQWIKKTYESVDRGVLREFVAARLKTFYEEELDVQLVIFDEVLDHVLRIDNVLRHPIGHMLLVGESGVGKTVLTRFVAWINGLNIFQIKANNRYTIEQFDNDLRALFRRVGIDGEKICFIFDESNALSSAFLERMNALLASGEVPGLFEGDEKAQLMAACREKFTQREGLVMDNEDELYRRFTKVIQRNLHVVFTMNPQSSDFSNRCNASPALFNRCVVDWFGTWSADALIQVAAEFTKHLDTGYTNYQAPNTAIDALNLTIEVMKSEDVSLREAAVAALVSMHDIAKQHAARMGKVGRQHYLSPRDFLDLISKFLKLENEMKEALQDQETHVRTGLQKLLETQDQVAEMNRDLTEKTVKLKAKDAEANIKLNQMVEKQNEAEQRKAVAEQLTIELQRQNEVIQVKKDMVEKELSEAEPALMSAKQSVSNIRKAQLDEVRALAHPPNAVRLTMEMVVLMIGESSTDWGDIRKVIRRDDFIATVVNFDPLALTARQIKLVTDNYLSNSDLDAATVDRASKACGPLYRWAGSQVKYATILRKVKPLRDEMTVLEEKLKQLAQQQHVAITEVETLEAAIATYKSEYAAAVRETEIIRTEMDSVARRVNRANALLLSLQEEKLRWESTAESFNQQMATLIGDSLLSAAFLTYAGVFDHKMRRILMAEWADAIEQLKIPSRPDLDMIAYLSKPTDQLKWMEYGLPNDALAIENAILLERFHRFPLVIDPSGQALKFIVNKFSAHKLVQTSFLDAAFMKTLASAIRFGNPLLVQDVENLDPVLNPVLNREVQRTGGRTLIRLGNEDIDFSPKFMIILLTRNPTAHFSPDLCSRVTIVNFTVTPASLEAQVLSTVLKTERPDVDKRRSDVLRLQGEQNAKLRELQDVLLDKISALQGAILDDDSVINTLESIKKDAASLNIESSRTAEILEEVKLTSNTFLPLASMISSTYFTLESLAEISKLYQYSLQYFLDILSQVMKETVASRPNYESNVSPSVEQARIALVKGLFLKELTHRVLPGLKYDDKLVFLVRLGPMSSVDQPDCLLTDSEADYLVKGAATVEISQSLLSKFLSSLTSVAVGEESIKRLVSLSLLPAWENISVSLTEDAQLWSEMLHSKEPETFLTMEFMQRLTNAKKLTGQRLALVKALLMRAICPERVTACLEEYITNCFGAYGFDWRDFVFVDLQYIVEQHSKAINPLLLCSEAGQDGSSKVDALCTAMGKKLMQVSMGSAEGYQEADSLIAHACKSGSYVLLKNVHLCLEWLMSFEKKLQNLTCHENFRLFMTCEMNENMPTSLVRHCEVLIFESSHGIKANLQRFLASVPSQRMERQPVERARLYALLAWFHAVVQERLRYAPIGWSKRYEFSDADLQCSLDVIDQWLEDIAGNRAHIDPDALPWQALQTLLSESLYGGRVDQTFDQLALESFVQSIFTAKNYSANAVLVTDAKGNALLSLPDSLSRPAFETWTKALPDSNSPAWIGLPVAAEEELQRSTAQQILSKLQVLEGLDEDQQHLQLASGIHRHPHAADAHSKQSQQQDELLERWLSSIPDASTLQRLLSQYEQHLHAQDHGAPPSALILIRTLHRELVTCLAVTRTIRHDLLLMRACLNGDAKPTNHIRRLFSCLRSGALPTHWQALFVSAHSHSLHLFVQDLQHRCAQVMSYEQLLPTLLAGDVFAGMAFCLGEMFSAEAFLMACRQICAQTHQCSLEALELVLLPAVSAPPRHFRLRQLVVQGAQFAADAALAFADDLHVSLPAAAMTWRPTRAAAAAQEEMQLPVYLNATRRQLVATAWVAVDATVPRRQWLQRAAAFLLQLPQL